MQMAYTQNDFEFIACFFIYNFMICNENFFDIIKASRKEGKSVMFEIENNKIGNYISSLITNKFDSARSFCREYLKISGEKINEDTIQNVANRLLQIKKGTKAIQIYDPLFFLSYLMFLLNKYLVLEVVAFKKVKE